MKEIFFWSGLMNHSTLGSRGKNNVSKIDLIVCELKNYNGDVKTFAVILFLYYFQFYIQFDMTFH